MKKTLSRRRFLEDGLKSSLAAGGVAVTGFGAQPSEALGAPVARSVAVAGVVMPNPPSSFNAHQSELLRAAMDEIVPAGEGMPAASEVQAFEYLARLASDNPGIKNELVQSLLALEDLCGKSFGKSFATLPRPERVQALAQFEQSASSDEFTALRDYVYEAYYTHPRVGKLLGYEFHATNESGPHMKPFDESVLAKVRNKPKMYREK